MFVRAESKISHSPENPPLTKATAYPKPDRFDRSVTLFDRLLRNIAIAGCLLLLVIAARNVGQEPLQAAYAALQESVTLEWDESLGKLTFVNQLLPQEIRTVWSEQAAQDISLPVQGRVVHAWSRQEPYVSIGGGVSEVHAVLAGEVMSLAHGPDEELILRIRHEDGLETLYGNLAACYVEEGDAVYEGDVIGRRMDEAELVFDMRLDGRSIDPTEWLANAND